MDLHRCYLALLLALSEHCLGRATGVSSASDPFVAIHAQSHRPKWVITLRTAVAGQFPQGMARQRAEREGETHHQIQRREQISGMLPHHGSPPATPTQFPERDRGSVEAGRPLKEAIKLLTASTAGDAPAEPGALNWPELAERLKLHKMSSGALAKESTWLKDYQPHMVQVIEVMQGKGSPKTGKQVLQALVTKYGGTPGSRGRQVRLQHAAQLLRFAVDECGAGKGCRQTSPSWWAPNLQPMQAATTAHHKDAQLTRLIEGIPTRGGSWRSADGLLRAAAGRAGYIRPTEDGARLYCGYSKRTAKGSTKPRGDRRH